MIAAVENAICERLRSASSLGLLGYKLKTVEPYTGQFNDEAELKAVFSKLPGVFVGLSVEKKVADVTYGQWRMEAVFSVFIGGENKRNQPGAARHGGAGDVGTYQMAKDARLLLADQNLGLEIGPLVPVLFKPFPLVKLADASVSIVVLEVKTSFVVRGLPNLTTALIPETVITNGVPPPSLANAMAAAAGITDLVTIHNDWDAPAPAADTMTMETEQ